MPPSASSYILIHCWKRCSNPSFASCRHMFCSSGGSSPTPNLGDDLVIWRFPVVDPTETSLLGSPLGAGTGMDRILLKRCAELERMLDRLGLLASQDALLIFRTAFGSPKLLNILRSSPCAEHPALVRFDELLCSGVSMVTNCAISDAAWIQASLLISDDGPGDS